MLKLRRWTQVREHGQLHVPGSWDALRVLVYVEVHLNSKFRGFAEIPNQQELCHLLGLHNHHHPVARGGYAKGSGLASIPQWVIPSCL